MIPTYHEVTASPSDYAYSVTAGQLAQHLRLLGGRPEVEVTFDDGHASNFRYALPVLEEHGRKAIFFITAGWTGARREYMDWSQLRELAALGHQIQAHGWNHKLLTVCGESELEEELGRARGELEDRLGARVDAVAAPGGRWNARVAAACLEHGYRRLYTSDAWRGRSPANQRSPAIHGRFMVRRNMTDAEFGGLLAMSPRTAAMLRGKDIARHTLRRLFGEQGYARLWSALNGEDRRGAIDEEYP